ncbi:hypothetical protein GB881_17185 [Georgenia subflava]|uniref:Uncharacterized protein n=1 Tax=Georgenia subflava TaxID=1622177 RepID=A0A6N7EL01_9MICO|nr:hypothetical protein [Georgenia subflava]
MAAGAQSVGVAAAAANAAPTGLADEGDLLGLEPPERPTALSYSASALDGNPQSGTMTTSAGGATDGGAAQGQNREARRAAAKAAKKRS